MTQHITFPRYLSILILLTLLGLSISAQTPKAVDLGLSVKWADCNLGATTPLQPGIPVAWGETKFRNIIDNNFTPTTYHEITGLNIDGYQYTGYYAEKELIDNKSARRTIFHGNLSSIKRVASIKPEFDVATVNLGNGWRLPTAEEWNELKKNCKIEWIPSGKNGYIKVIGPNGNSITLPTTGGHYVPYNDIKKKKSNSKSKFNDQHATYWSSDVQLIDRDRIEPEHILHFNFMNSPKFGFSADISWTGEPWEGRFVRAVYDPSLDDNKGNNNNDKKVNPNPGPKPKPDPSPVVNTTRPELTFIGWSESTHSPKVTLKVGVKSKSAITGSTVTVNGQQTRGIKAVNNDGYDMMIRQEITLREGTNTVKVEVTNGAGTTSKTMQVSYMPVINDNKGAIPELTFIGWSESTHSPKVTLKVGVKSKSAITGSTVTVNGQQTRGIKAVNNDGYDMMIRQEINLQEGTNTVKVEVTNGAGTASKTAQVFYMPVVEDDKKEVTQQLRKVAYVVGNSNYPGNELPNPKNDATDISAKLRSLGFEVITLIDGTRRQIEDGISTFSRKAADADVAMFFYAGHGIQYNGANYLIPVDAVLRSAKDIDYECTDVNRLLANMEESGCKMNIIALDACRNNPFERGWYRGSTSRGLSAINAPIGTFISYATSPGSVAADGTTRNSPYTSALLKTLDRPGLTIEGVFKNVGAEVVKATNRNQTPWYSSSIYQGEFIFNPSK